MIVGEHTVSPNAHRSEYKNIVVTNWMIWVPAQVLNFRLIPLQHRQMFSNIIALIWNTYLAYKANSVDHVTSSEDVEITLTESAND
jgi:protein Mpv17